ncbi:hypothetical protein ES703_77852 [subsurface metagenome]
MKQHPLLTKASLAIVAIMILEGLAILKGIDGALFGLAVTAIAGLGGYTIGRRTGSK